MENKPLDPNQKAKIVAEAMVKHMAPVAPLWPVKEIIAVVRRGGEESMLELDVMKMLTSYFWKRRNFGIPCQKR